MSRSDQIHLINLLSTRYLSKMTSRCLPKFSVKNYSSWSRRIKAHLLSQHENMWQIISNGHIQIEKVNTDKTNNGLPKLINKPIDEWTSEDRKRFQLEFMAPDIIFSILDEERNSQAKDVALFPSTPTTP